MMTGRKIKPKMLHKAGNALSFPGFGDNSVCPSTEGAGQQQDLHKRVHGEKITFNIKSQNAKSKQHFR